MSLGQLAAGSSSHDGRVNEVAMLEFHLELIVPVALTVMGLVLKHFFG